MEEPHLKFHRILISQPSNSEAVRAEEVLERINQVNGYIHRLIQAYHLALQQIGQLKTGKGFTQARTSLTCDRTRQISREG
ncbi:MAG: hypothetical protein HC769_35610 [Cyanobacteria bacterium CRU_2_1]|nr:hypothetical protein [Cyanobacteria bacterium CRU_2_1]